MPFYTAWKTVSSTPSNYWKDSFQALVDEQFEDSPTIKTVLHNGTSVVVRVVGKFNTETLSRNNDDYQKIIFQDYNYTVSVGDLFVFDSLTYLCTGISSNTVTKSCSVQLTNNTLKFYSPTSLTLYDIPCIITNKLTLSDDENKYLTTVDNQFYLMVSSTSTTKEIKPDNIFKLGTYNYQVTTVFDDVTIPGILIFKMKYSEVEATTHVFVTTILNGATASIQQGNTLQLNVEVTDNGTVLSPTPTVTYVSSDTTKCTVSSTGLVTGIATGSCVITASANGTSDTISITVVAVPANNYSYSLSSVSTPDTEIKLNQTKTYTVTKYNNGVAIVQGFTFSVSGEATAYTLTTVDSNNCSIKCLKSGYTVVLSATDSSDVTKITTKTIVLKSLF